MLQNETASSKVQEKKMNMHRAMRMRPTDIARRVNIATYRERVPHLCKHRGITSSGRRYACLYQRFLGGRQRLRSSYLWERGARKEKKHSRPLTRVPSIDGGEEEEELVP